MECNHAILYLGQVGLVLEEYVVYIEGFPAGVYSDNFVSWSGWSFASGVCSIIGEFLVWV